MFVSVTTTTISKQAGSPAPVPCPRSLWVIQSREAAIKRRFLMVELKNACPTHTVIWEEEGLLGGWLCTPTGTAAPAIALDSRLLSPRWSDDQRFLHKY
jgi:hypothetical protein